MIRFRRKKRSRTKMTSLPVDGLKDEILRLLPSTQVLFVTGDTGSGKSTRIPLLLMEPQRDARVVCSEPRRVAAMSLARYVARERGEDVGDSIGYAIKDDHKAPRNDRGVIFATPKIALHMLARRDCKASV